MNYKKDFPIFGKEFNGLPLIYLDSAATSQKPQVVIDEITNFYSSYNANVHRGVHSLGYEATSKFENARELVSKFINAASVEEIIFAKGTTDGMNKLAYSLGATLKEGDEIIISPNDHHSSILPWQNVAKKTGATLKYFELNDDHTINMSKAKELITSNTKVVSLAQIHNTYGIENDVKELGKLVHAVNGVIVVDGAQSVPHIPVDVKDLDCDFLCFSSHKMCGPTGMGIIYGKKEHLLEMQPFEFGGEMIDVVDYYESTYKDLPYKFEAGTPNVAGVIGLGKAVEYLTNVGMDKVEEINTELTHLAYEKLSEIEGVNIYSPKDNRAGIILFNIDGIHSHDVTTILDSHGVQIRAGHHCAQLVMKDLQVNSTCRASFYLYNDQSDVQALVKAIKHAKEVFGNG